MEERKPIRRSPELVSLSHDHHDALLFVWKLRQGLKNETGLTEITEYTGWYWQNHLEQHFQQEENILAPHFPESDPLFSRMRKEHSIIRELVASLEIHPVKADISRLAGMLYDHIRFEERTLFPYAEKELQPEQLRTIASQLSQHPACNKEWTNEFWTGKR